MLSKVIFAFVFTLTSLALGAEIMLQQEDDGASSNLESDSIGSVADLATSNSDLSKSREVDSSSDELDDWTTMTDSSVTDNIVDPIRRRRPGRMRPMMRRMAMNALMDYDAAMPATESRFQLINFIDRLRQAQSVREDAAGRSRMMPLQNQLVDSTLRLMAIKSSLDDLLMSAFPNLRMLQRMFMERE